jgi:hypothetical protein
LDLSGHLGAARWWSEVESVGVGVNIRRGESSWVQQVLLAQCTLMIKPRNSSAIFEESPIFSSADPTVIATTRIKGVPSV